MNSRRGKRLKLLEKNSAKEETMTVVQILIGMIFVCAAFAAWQWYTGRTSVSPSVFDKVKDWWKEMSLREAKGYLAGLIGVSCVLWIVGIYAHWIIYLIYYITPAIAIVIFYQAKIKGRKENNKGKTP